MTTITIIALAPEPERAPTGEGVNYGDNVLAPMGARNMLLQVAMSTRGYDLDPLPNLSLEGLTGVPDALTELLRDQDTPPIRDVHDVEILITFPDRWHSYQQQIPDGCRPNFVGAWEREVSESEARWIELEIGHKVTEADQLFEEIAQQQARGEGEGDVRPEQRSP